MRSYVPGLAVASVACMLAACGPVRGFTPPDGDAQATADGAGDGGDAGTGDVVAADHIATDVTRVDTGMGPPDMTIVYAHSDTVLFSVDPNHSDAFRMIGTFAFPAGDSHNHAMTDIAVDATGAIVGTTQNALWRIDATSAACAFVAALPGGNEFVGLTYVPAGTLDPTTEVLVGGATNGTFFRIDTTSGVATMLGQLHDTHGTWALSGDFVSIAGAATYATLRSSMGTTTNDTLATVDLGTGLVHVLGTTGFVSIYGLGYWRSTLFGFTRSGQFITIDVTTAHGTLSATPTSQFSGAGVTTVAPIAPG